MRLVPAILASCLATCLALGAAGPAQSAEANPGVSLPPGALADFAKWKGHKMKGYKVKAYKPGRAYGYYGNRGRRVGWYKKGRAYGARRVYYRF